MFKVILKKEIRYNFTSPRFISLFLLSSILILLSVFTGIQEFKFTQKQYQAGIQLLNQDLNERTTWSGVETKAFREPNPMQIFYSGISNDIGRFSGISQWSNIKLQNSNYEDETLFAIFRNIDFVFIIQIVFSLIAILMTYDAINGERESGTLKLILASGISRKSLILGKISGNMISILMPLSVPVLLGLLVLILAGIPLSIQNWLAIFLLTIISISYILFFQVFGVLVSSVTKSSANSFLILLVTWIFLVLIIPRTGIILAGQIIPVPSVAEIESQSESFEKEEWKKHERILGERWHERSTAMTEMDSEARQNYEDENMWDWMQEDDASRKETQEAIAEFSRKQNEDLRNKRKQLEKTGFLFSRISPAAIYALTAMDLCDTDTQLKSRTELAMQNFQEDFNKFIEKKQEENQGNAGIRITMDSERGFSFTTPDLLNTIEAQEIPRYQDAKIQYGGILQGVMFDFSLLIALTVIIFGMTFIVFNRYDVR
jgi:ABC-type transport system involved in multi-copper enzyme maturation permease subunit